MAHNLMMQNGRAAMMYVGDPPWHRLGTALPEPPTAQEAIQAAKLDWEVIKVPLYAGPPAAPVAVPSRVAVVRKDQWGQPDCPVLGVVGPHYRVLQNRDAFAFFDGVLRQEKATYHTAGALGAGERIWVLVRFPEPMEIVSGDVVDRYLLLSNGHDGRTSVQVRFTPVRVVCQNTLTMALRGAGGWSVTHKPDLPQRLEAVGRMVAMVRRTFAALHQTYRAMAGMCLTTAGLESYLTSVFPPPRVDRTGRLMKQANADRRAAARLMEEGWGNNLRAVRGTLWAAYNGVTQYVDYERSRARGASQLRLIWFGRGAAIKARALAAARAYLAARN